jgi:hypothetical protein
MISFLRKVPVMVQVCKCRDFIHQSGPVWLITCDCKTRYSVRLTDSTVRTIARLMQANTLVRAVMP